MENVIFALYLRGDSFDLLDTILIDSLYTFGEKYANNQIVIGTENFDSLGYKISKKYSRSSKIEIIDINVQKDLTKFPFMAFVKAAAEIERYVEDETNNLVWLGSNSLILQEPSNFILPTEKTLGYRPVHITNIGSPFSEPINRFWDFIYRKCQINEENIFAIKTHVDNNILRPYFNAGCLIVRPNNFIFHKWFEKYVNVYNDKELELFYAKNPIYKIFIHQAVLAGIILSSMKKNDLYELPNTYNYPLHLHSTATGEDRLKNIDDIIMARFEERDDLEMLKNVTQNEKIKNWLTNSL